MAYNINRRNFTVYLKCQIMLSRCQLSFVFLIFYGSMVEIFAQHLNKILEMEYKLEFMYQISVMHCKDRSNNLRYPISRKYSSADTLHHISRAKLFTENSAMARLRDILRSWGPADPLKYTQGRLIVLSVHYLMSV